MVYAVYQALLVINLEEGNQVSHQFLTISIFLSVTIPIGNDFLRAYLSETNTPFAMTLFLSYLHELQDYKIIYLKLSHIFERNGERSKTCLSAYMNSYFVHLSL